LFTAAAAAAAAAAVAGSAGACAAAGLATDAPVAVLGHQQQQHCLQHGVTAAASANSSSNRPAGGRGLHGVWCAVSATLIESGMRDRFLDQACDGLRRNHQGQLLAQV
jgi:hypothetical protein